MRLRAPAADVRIAALVHLAPPRHGAGAEWYLHDFFRWLVARGHEASVFVGRGREAPYELDGVRYTATPTIPKAEALAADLLVTHLDMTPYAVRLARGLGKPLAHICHNHRQLAYHRVRPSDAALVIFNSRWVARSVKWAGVQAVLPPPVFASRYAVKREGDAITLLNLSEAKGGPLLFELARRMPRRRFLAVKGAYARQEIPDIVPPNVEVIDNQPDVREVYRRTRLLLMPSSYESWGRCAVEAAASGIPTIAHPTPGLLESVGPCAVFCDRDDPSQWERAIAEFDNRDEYRRAGRRAQLRAVELDPVPTLEAVESLLEEVAAEGRPVRQRVRASA